MKLCIDTNVLVYAVSSTGDMVKHAQALSIIDQVGRAGVGVLSTQALLEFTSVVLRKRVVPADDVFSYVQAFAAKFPVVGTSFDEVAAAIQANRDHGLPIWDAMIWAVSRRAGASLLLSEDFQDGRVLDGVRFVNPFNPANAPLIDAALTP